MKSDIRPMLQLAVIAVNMRSSGHASFRRHAPIVMWSTYRFSRSCIAPLP